MSSIASSNKLEGSSMLPENFKSGSLCPWPPKSSRARLNVLFESPESSIFSLFLFNSRVKTSEDFALLSICFKLSRLTEISRGSSTEYSTKAELSKLNLTIATLAGSIATSSILSLPILKVTSFTNSEMMFIGSLKNLPSAKVSFISL